MQLKGDIRGFAIGCETSSASPHSFGVEGIASLFQILNSRNPHRPLNFSIAQAFFFGRCLHSWLTWGHGRGRRILISPIDFSYFKSSEPLNHARDVDGATGCAE